MTNFWSLRTRIGGQHLRIQPFIFCHSFAFPKQKDLSRTEQRCVRTTAIKINTTDTHLDLFIASWITTHLVCNSCKPTSVLTGTTNNQVPSIKVGHGRAQI